MKNKLISFISSCVILGLLVAGSIYNVEWALTTVQIVYWIGYILSFVALSICTWAMLADYGDINDKMAEHSVWLGLIISAITVALLLHAELLALAIVAILVKLHETFLVYVAKEITKDE